MDRVPERSNAAGAASADAKRSRRISSHLPLHAAHTDRIVGHYPRDKIRGMILRGNAWRDESGRVRLIGIGEEHPCRTHTGRGGIMGAIGRGQCYTTHDSRGNVDGLRKIWPEDRHVFIAAVTREPV